MTSTRLIAVVDDDEAVRTSTAQLLERTGHAVLAFSSGDSFLAAQLPSEVGCVLLDIRMAGSDGLQVMRMLQARNSLLAVIVLTGHGDVALAVEAMKLGAADFLEKPYHPESLLQAIERAVSDSVTSAESQNAASEAREKVAALSERQRDVLRGILRGKQSKIIAHELDLSPRTVEAYRAQ